MKRNPGKCNKSRWLTTANRISRLYISTENPTKELQLIVEFIMKVYRPMWFNIKCFHSFDDGARNLHLYIKLSRYLGEKPRKMVEKVILQNAYFVYVENIIIAMLHDHRLFIRQLALDRIKDARLNDSSTARIRCQLHWQ